MPGIVITIFLDILTVLCLIIILLIVYRTVDEVVQLIVKDIRKSY